MYFLPLHMHTVADLDIKEERGESKRSEMLVMAHSEYLKLLWESDFYEKSVSLFSLREK
jgi:hypothetical protein